MTHKELKEQVWAHNLRLAESGLVTLTWGNVSALSEDGGAVAIKPSGIPYEVLEVEHIVVVDLEGNVVDGALRPSSDTPTHLEIYRAFDGVGGVAHSHSARAVSFAQARREIPCLGTTHADHFHGPVPLTRVLTESEVAQDYEANTGRVIAERFLDLDPHTIPAVLVPGHGPFTWGSDAAAAVDNAIALEDVADMAMATLALAPDATLEPWVRDKHFARKHGDDAYYGQE